MKQHILGRVVSPDNSGNSNVRNINGIMNNNMNNNMNNFNYANGMRLNAATVATVAHNPPRFTTGIMTQLNPTNPFVASTFVENYNNMMSNNNNNNNYNPSVMNIVTPVGMSNIRIASQPNRRPTFVAVLKARSSSRDANQSEYKIKWQDPITLKHCERWESFPYLSSLGLVHHLKQFDQAQQMPNGNSSNNNNTVLIDSEDSINEFSIRSSSSMNSSLTRNINQNETLSPDALLVSSIISRLGGESNNNINNNNNKNLNKKNSTKKIHGKKKRKKLNMPEETTTKHGNSDVFYVEAILSRKYQAGRVSRKKGSRKRNYLVKWHQYDMSHNTWESEQSLRQDKLGLLIDVWERKNKNVNNGNPYVPVGFEIGKDGKLTHDIVVRPSLTSGGTVNTTINKRKRNNNNVSYGGKQMVNGNNTNRNIVKSKNKCPICNWFCEDGLSSSLIIHMKNKHSSNLKKRKVTSNKGEVSIQKQVEDRLKIERRLTARQEKAKLNSLAKNTIEELKQKITKLQDENDILLKKNYDLTISNENKKVNSSLFNKINAVPTLDGSSSGSKKQSIKNVVVAPTASTTTTTSITMDYNREKPDYSKLNSAVNKFPKELITCKRCKRVFKSPAGLHSHTRNRDRKCIIIKETVETKKLNSESDRKSGEAKETKSNVGLVLNKGKKTGGVFGFFAGLRLAENTLVHCRYKNGKSTNFPDHYPAHVLKNNLDGSVDVRFVDGGFVQRRMRRNDIKELRVKLTRFNLRAGDLRVNEQVSVPYLYDGKPVDGWDVPGLTVVAKLLEIPDSFDDGDIIVAYAHTGRKKHHEYVNLNLVEFAPRVLEENFIGK